MLSPPVALTGAFWLPFWLASRRLASAGVVAPTFNPNTEEEVDIGESLSWRPAWPTQSVPVQPGLHSEIPAQQNREDALHDTT